MVFYSIFFIDFHDKVEQRRNEAEEELIALPDIEREINAAIASTRDAELAVGDANQNANDALKLVEEANLKAHNLAKETSKLGEKAEQIGTKLVENHNLIDSFSTEIDALGAITKEFENQVFFCL